MERRGRFEMIMRNVMANEELRKCVVDVVRVGQWWAVRVVGEFVRNCIRR